MQAKDLKVGDIFRAGKQRKWRMVNRVELGVEDGVFVCYNGCMQMILSPTTHIELRETSHMTESIPIGEDGLPY